QSRGPFLLLAFLSTEAPSLHRRYPASSVVRTSPPPHTTRPGSRELSVDPYYIIAGASRVTSDPLACMPSPLPRQVQWNLFARTVPLSSAFPEIQAGRPLHYPFRGLLSVYSRYG